MIPQVRQNYLRALNMPDFLCSVAEAKTLPAIPYKCLVVEVETQNSFCRPGQSYDFLEKMLGAIGLSMTDVKCVSATNQTLSDVISKNPARTVLVMGGLTTLKLDKVHVTHHPHEILNNPGLKREAWEVLKEVKRCLK